jgi:uncharacterized protein
MKNRSALSFAARPFRLRAIAPFLLLTSSSNKKWFARALGLSVLLVLATVIARLIPPSSALTNSGVITVLDTPLTENFDSLASTGTGIAWVDNSTIPGFYSTRATYNPGTGSSNAGSLYSFGVAGTNPVTDRALGSVASGATGTIYTAARLTNSTGSTISSLDISYVGEQWRNGGNVNANSLTFQYQVANAGAITGANTPTTGWTTFSALSFTSPITGATAATLDGNAAANRTLKTANLPLIANNGQEIWLRWQDPDDAGSDHGLAIDELSITARSTPTPTNPSGVGLANPSTVTPGGSTLLTVTVTPGTNPTSTGITVVGDLTSIGGVNNQSFLDDGAPPDVSAGDNIFTYQATVSNSTTVGAKILPITLMDAQGRSANPQPSISLTVQAAVVPAGSVVISQVYGGGGNTGAPLKNDFIELFNRTTNPIDITGWSVQYTSAAGTTWQVTGLSGTIAPGKYYLVQEAAGNSCAGSPCGINLPVPDATGAIPMAAGSGKVALVTTGVALSGSGCPFTGAVQDFVGYGTANCFEGGAAAPTLSNPTAALRALNGCQDTDNNAADFSAHAPSPRNSSSPFTDCNAPPPPPVPINQIQGSGSSSPLVGQQVSTTISIVTGLRSNGFFIQTPEGADDGDPNTSEGVFVFTSSAPPAAAAIGNAVTVRGTVQEFIPSADVNSPPVTEIGSPTVSFLSAGNPLPTPITLTAADTSPSGSIEQLEKYEGMRVHVDSLTVIAPTQGTVNEANATAISNGVFYGVITGVARPFREPGIEVPDPLPAGSPCCVPRYDANAERLRVDSDSQPGSNKIDVGTGAVVTNLTGPLDYSFRTYTILPDAATPPGVSGVISATPVPVAAANEFTIASFNMERFFDTVDDPPTQDVVLTTTAFNNRLNKASLAIRNVMRSPDIIGVEEMENLTTLQAVATKVNNDAVAAGDPNPNYQAYLEEGNDIGGIDSGFLVKTSRVNVIDVTQEGKDTTYIDPNNNQPALLNDRPPLILRATIQPSTGLPFPVTVIVNHLRSLSGVDDPADGNRVRTKRRAQAEFLANLIQARQSANPNEHIISVGDYNAFQFNDGYGDSIGTIKGTPTPFDQVVLASTDLVNPDLTDLVDLAPADQRYSFSFDGNAQELDHILVTQNVLDILSGLSYARNDADFPEIYRGDPNRPERISDHDMPVAYFVFPEANLSVVKTAPASVQTVAQFSYTITVTNNSSVSATDVVVSDTLPAEVSFVSCSSTGGGVCGGSGNNRSVTFSSLPGGSSAVITIDAALNCSVADAAVVTNTATVSSSTTDPDPSNNSSVASITASNPPPVLTCPPSIVTTNAPNQCGAAVTFPDPTVNDNCPGGAPVCNPASGSFFPVGTTTVTCNVTDAGGASGSCSFTVTVNDTQPPSITCPANVTIGTDPGVCTTAVVNYASPTVNDNCPGVGSPSCVPASGSTFPTGTTTVSCSVTDAHGNSNSCSFTVTVNAPQLSSLSPAMVWIGLKSSDDVGTKFDLLAEVLKNGVVVGTGQVNDVPGGSSGFNNASLRAITLALSTGAVGICPGDTLGFRLSVRIAATSGHNSGFARLWYNGAAIDTGPSRDAGSRFGATIGGAADYFLRSGSLLNTTAGSSKLSIDVLVNRNVGGNAFKPFGTWNKTF